MKHINIIFLSFLFSLFLSNCTKKSSKATIKEENIRLKTYMFSDPDPIPNIGNIYPYFQFDGYTNHAIYKDWKMVVLENDFIKVFVAPEIGGKVYGAIEKTTGKEFLYYNNVVKFRNVAARGPWTSGGLEFNFGDIGHIPTCATPVDYEIKENKDGSVSCIVGAMDLPSRTRWSVEIKLPKDKAFFETKASWFNTTNESCTYYHWMNAAAKASHDLEFIYPGINYIGHEGEVSHWPMKDDKDLSKYKENNFGSYKSYHVINAYANYFGGYWHNDDFGFGHYANYDEKPGKKLWIWGLSQQGMIWEDLLTDNDGQYIEYQAGKLYNQAANSSTFTPFKHKEFQPYDTDIMRELWFPIKGTKGMMAVSEYGILNIEEKPDSLHIYLSALQYIKDTLTIQFGEQNVKHNINLQPLELFKTSVSKSNSSALNITLGNNLLNYSNKEKIIVDRPTLPIKEFNWDSAYGHFTIGLELEKQRLYVKALDSYKKSIEKDAGFLPALNRLALSYYRIMDYEKALEYCNKALSIDTYDGEANYNYGLINKILGNISNAKSGFSIASQDIKVRAASYVELAKIFVIEKNYTKALHYASRGINYNANSIVAHDIIAYANRKLNEIGDAKTTINKIYNLDPLSDFAKFEEVLLNIKDVSDFNTKITNELPFESYLELALSYYSYNDKEAAIKVLKQSPKQPIVQLWLAYLSEDPNSDFLNEALNTPINMVFPHRIETFKMLKHFNNKKFNWKLNYYLALIYANKGLIVEAKELFMACENLPQESNFYITRAKLKEKLGLNFKDDIEKAYELNPEDWRVSLEIINQYIQSGKIDNALPLVEKLQKQHPENSKIFITYAQTLLKDKQYKKCIEFLENNILLPNEGSFQGKKIYTEACIQQALSLFENGQYKQAITYAEKAKLWPKNLGAGKPYDTDQRLENFIIARANELLGDKSLYKNLSNYKQQDYMKQGSMLVFQLLALKKLGKQKEANALIKNSLNKDGNNTYLKWVNAKFENNDLHETLENNILNKKITVYDNDSGFIDLKFPIVLEVLKRLNL